MADSLPLSFCFPPKPKEAEDRDAQVYRNYAEAAKTLPESQCWPAAPLPLRQYQGFRFYGVESVMAVQDHFTARPGDILLATLPKVGTTWLKSLAFAVANRAPTDPFPLSALLSHNPHECVPFLELWLYNGKRIPDTAAIPSPRLLATHMRYDLLPKSALDVTKIVYLCRNPRDTFVSLWHYMNNMYASDQPVVGLEHALDCFLAGIHIA